MQNIVLEDVPKMSLVVEGKYKITSKLGEGEKENIFWQDKL